MKELNQKQIEYLFNFVDEKGVKYYDVQHEVVDHLASSIECEMNEDENMSFESALNKVYSKYPITGFAQYTLELEDSLWKFWIRTILNSFTKGYGAPLIGLLVALTYSIYFSIQSNGATVINSIYYGTLALVIIAFVTFGRQFGKSAIEMMIYSEFLLNKDDLKSRLMYYRVLKAVTATLILIPAILTRLFCTISLESQLETLTGNSNIILLLSIFSSLTIYITLAVILHFPDMIKDVIAKKYSHVVIA